MKDSSKSLIKVSLTLLLIELDLIIGGHSHSFLFNGDKLPSVETSEGHLSKILMGH